MSTPSRHVDFLRTVLGDQLEVQSDNNGWPARVRLGGENHAADVDLHVRTIGDSHRNRATERRFQNPSYLCAKAGRHQRWQKHNHDTRADTVTAYLDMVAHAKPRVLLMENVPAFAGKSEAFGLNRLHRGLLEVNERAETNYRLQYKVLQAADYGVPQLRERVFVVAERSGAAFTFPKPTHAPAAVAPELGLARYANTWDAIGTLAPDESEKLEVTGKHAIYLPSVPEGKNYLWHTERGGGRPKFGWHTRYWSFLLKLAKNLPSWTLAAQPGSCIGPFHWDSRRLSRAELCALQTFPSRVQVTGGRTAIQRQIGNAVPSLLAEVLARQVRATLLGLPVSKRPRLRVPARKCAEAELPGPLPWDPDYDGTVPLAHPGAGLGPAPLGRREIELRAVAPSV